MVGVCAVCGKPAETYYCDFCGEDIGRCCENKPATRAWAAAKAQVRKYRGVVAQLLGRRAG